MRNAYTKFRANRFRAEKKTQTERKINQPKEISDGNVRKECQYFQYYDRDDQAVLIKDKADMFVIVFQEAHNSKTLGEESLRADCVKSCAMEYY